MFFFFFYFFWELRFRTAGECLADADQSALPYSTPATSPPTPSRASDIMTTRSGSTITRGSSMKALAPKSSRVEKSTPKKKERAKAVKRIPKLDRPLSEVTKDSPVEVVDIETYVNRSAEQRHKEVADGKIPGKIKRPMNAFMLYRKAYQNRAKDWCSQHNHQVVSQVCGDSWPLEPEHIRLQFNEWAKLERDNHQKSHPGYKFTPSKPQKPKIRKEFDDAEASDGGDYDWDSRRADSSRNRSRTRTPKQESEDYQAQSAYHQHYSAGGARLPPQNRSVFHFSNPGKPMPAPYDQRDLPGHYYQTTHFRDPQRQPMHGTVEDLVMRKTPSPGTAFQQPGQVDPGFDFVGYHHHHHQQGYADQLHPHQHPHPHGQAVSLDQRIDPSLLAAEGGFFDPGMGGGGGYMLDGGGHLDAQQRQQAWQMAHMGGGMAADDGQFPAGLLGLNETLLQERHTQLLKGTEDSWHVETLDGTSQFDNWVDAQAMDN